MTDQMVPVPLWLLDQVQGMYSDLADKVEAAEDFLRSGGVEMGVEADELQFARELADEPISEIQELVNEAKRRSMAVSA